MMIDSTHLHCLCCWAVIRLLVCTWFLLIQPFSPFCFILY